MPNNLNYRYPPCKLHRKREGSRFARRVQEAYRKKGRFSNRFWREANKNMLIKPPFLFKGRTVLHKKLVYNFLSTSLYIIFFSWPVPRMIAPAGGPLFLPFICKIAHWWSWTQNCNPAYYAKRSSLKEEGSFNARKTLFFYSLKFLYLLLNIAWYTWPLLDRVTLVEFTS